MASTSVTTYDIGDKVRITATFTSTAGTNADPTAVTVKHKDPSGNLTTVDSTSVTNSATGVYYADLEPDEAGVWHYSIGGTGNVVAYAEDWFRVRHVNVST